VLDRRRSRFDYYQAPDLLTSLERKTHQACLRTWWRVGFVFAVDARNRDTVNVVLLYPNPPYSILFVRFGGRTTTLSISFALPFLSPLRPPPPTAYPSSMAAPFPDAAFFSLIRPLSCMIFIKFLSFSPFTAPFPFSTLAPRPPPLPTTVLREIPFCSTETPAGLFFVCFTAAASFSWVVRDFLDLFCLADSLALAQRRASASSSQGRGRMGGFFFLFGLGEN
jgi:hypothetical protein